MSTEAARSFHRDLRRVIRDYVPKQVLIDGFWSSLKQRQKFVNSPDKGYRWGCWETVGIAHLSMRL